MRPSSLELLEKDIVEMLKSPAHSPPPKQSGFTLVEMSIVLVIVATLLVPLIQAYNAYVNEEKIRITKANIKLATGAMAASDPRYAPCPSDRSIPLGNANYGLEQCDLATIPLCNAGGLPAQGICKVRGSRDTVNDGVSVKDWIVIGGVPSRLQPPAPSEEIRILKGDDVLDGWGHLLNYAVSEKVMDHTNTSGNENYKHGVINAQDENGNPTAGIAATPDGDAEFVIWSSGPNGAGAYSFSGLEVAPCPNGATANRDTENCNNDNVFVQGIGNYEAGGASYLDDTSYFYLQTSGDLWTYAAPRTNGAPAQHIYNLNTDKVVISKTTTLSPASANPAYKLWVEGDISAATVLAQTYTTSGVSNPSPDGFALGTGGDKICSSVVGQGIFSGWFPPSQSPFCTFPILKPMPGSIVSCPAGSWVQGITTKHCVLCSNGTEQCPP